jgi:TetR/AcrR family transcriptional repressor of bet genes
LLKVYQRRLRSNLLVALRPLAGNRAEELADGLGALIDGVYLREALKSGSPDGKIAAAFAFNYLKSQLKGFIA